MTAEDEDKNNSKSHRNLFTKRQGYQSLFYSMGFLSDDSESEAETSDSESEDDQGKRMEQNMHGMNPFQQNQGFGGGFGNQPSFGYNSFGRAPMKKRAMKSSYGGFNNQQQP